MQILKRLISHCETKSVAVDLNCLSKQSPLIVIKKQAQNLIEFVFIFPILIFLTLAILEVALFWQDVNAIYGLNTEINANVALINPTNMTIGSTCTAATEALRVLVKKDSIISLADTTYTKNIVVIDGITQGTEPFALYKYVSAASVTVSGVTKPRVTMWVDCRSPFEDGITTQIEFYHKILFMKASVPRFDGGSPIEIIPDSIFIASPKLNTIRHY